MNSIRSSVHDLHDDAIDLENAIKGLVKDFTFCPVTLTYDMSRQIPRGGEIQSDQYYKGRAFQCDAA